MSGECNICGEWGCVEYNHIKGLKVTPSKLKALLNKWVGYRFMVGRCKYEIIESNNLTGEIRVINTSTGECFSVTIYNKML